MGKTNRFFPTLAFLLVLCLSLSACAQDEIHTPTVTDPSEPDPYVDHAVTVGDQILDSATFNYYYVDAVSYFYTAYYEQFGSNAQIYIQLYTGLDPSKALGDQVYDKQTGKTWADYFIEEAKNNARWTVAMVAKGESEGFQLTQDEQKMLDGLVESMEITAKNYGYNGFLGYLQTFYGKNATVESFVEYYTANIYSTSFAAAYYDSLQYTDADYREYEKDQYFRFSSYTYASYYVNVADYLALQEGTTVTGSDGKTSVTYSDEEKAAAAAAAKKDADLLAGCPTLEELNSAIGGLEVFAGAEKKEEATVSNRMRLSSVTNEDLATWLAEEGRKPGDAVCFENKTEDTVEGYYIRLLLKYDDNTVPLANVRHVLIAFQGGTTDNTTGQVSYSEAEKAAAREEAEKLLNEWLSGDRTDQSFAELADVYSADSPAGGLYEDITPDTKFVESFLNWCFASHEPGDTGIVESVYGYHIMYYRGDDALTYRDHLIRMELAERDFAAWETAVQENVTVTEVDLSCVDRTMTLLG